MRTMYVLPTLLRFPQKNQGQRIIMILKKKTGTYKQLESAY